MKRQKHCTKRKQQVFWFSIHHEETNICNLPFYAEIAHNQKTNKQNKKPTSLWLSSCRIQIKKKYNHVMFLKYSFKKSRRVKGSLRISMEISLCTEKGTSYRLFVTVFRKNHTTFSFDPTLNNLIGKNL